MYIELDNSMIIENNDIIIPFYISKYGLITGQLFLINAIVCFVNNYILLSSLLSILYITTILHWNKIKKNGIIRTIDITFAIITIIRITLYDSYYFIPNYKVIWNLYVIISSIIFCINEYIFIKNKHYNNEYIYYRNVFIHLLFLHIIPNTLCIICIISTHR